MPTDSSVSIILPAYNGRAFIHQALESALAQTLPAMEIIVVDDASTDGTPEIVGEFADRGPVRLLRLPRNSGGPARPLNAGIAAASGEFIAVIEQDDIFLPTKLAKQVSQLQQRPQCSFVFSLCANVAAPGMILQEPLMVEQLLREMSDAGRPGVFDGSWFLNRLLDVGNFVYGFPAFLFRRTTAVARGGVDERFRIAADYNFLCSLCTLGDVAFSPEILYLKRFHPGNLCNARFATRREIYQVRRNYGARLVAREGPQSSWRSLRESIAGVVGLPSRADVRRFWFEAAKTALRAAMPRRVFDRLRLWHRGIWSLVDRGAKSRRDAQPGNGPLRRRP